MKKKDQDVVNIDWRHDLAVLEKLVTRYSGSGGASLGCMARTWVKKPSAGTVAQWYSICSVSTWKALSSIPRTLAKG